MLDNGITKAKLSPLQVRPNHLRRTRLLDQLSSLSTRKLTLISAPAGCGKSSLVSDWVQTLSVPWALVTLDAHDDDLLAFAWVLVGAIRGSVPDAMVSSFRFVTQAESLEPVALASVLVSDLDHVEPELILVLDGYQDVQSPAIHELVTHILHQLPEQVRLVIATRSDPPLSLPALRVQGELGEIRAEDLRFDRSEVDELVTMSMTAPEPELARILMDRAEGWAAGLQLYLDELLRAQWQRKDTRSAWLLGRDHADAFLVAEMVASYTGEARQFLLQTSILGEFSAPLCDGLLGESAPPDGSHAMIQQLRQQNCLIEAVGSSSRWYRYHRLLRTVLEEELRRTVTKSEILDLHRRASRWLAENTYLEQALHHAIETGDLQFCAEILDDTQEAILDRDDWPTLDRALRQLPADALNDYPQFLIAKAWPLHFRNRYAALEIMLDRLEQQIATVSDPAAKARYAGQLAVFRAGQSFMTAESPSRVVAFARDALELLPKKCRHVRGVAVSMAGMASHWAGHEEDAAPYLRRLLETDHESNPTYRARILQALAYIYAADGDIVRVEQAGRQLVALATKEDLGIGAGWGHLALGLAAYEQNHLEVARQQFSAAIAVRDRAHAIAAREARLGLAQVSLLLGSGDLARGLIAGAIEASELTQSAADLTVEYSFQARLMLAEGRLDEARVHLRSLPGDALPSHIWGIEAPSHTRVRILLALGEEAHVSQACRMLDTLAAWYQSHCEWWRLTQVRALKALALRAAGLESESLDELSAAIELAEPRGLLRTFLDLGPPMAALLSAMPRKSRGSPYVARLMAEFQQIPTQQLDADEGPQNLDLSLYEALTWREIEILQLLEARLSNKEIATTLTVSVETVKKHAANIYRKLRVQGRRQAVSIAHDLRILSGAM